jgi:hypothetical protein
MSCVVVQLHQRDTRCIGASPYIDAGIAVLTVPRGGGKPTLVATSGLIVDRQAQLETVLRPGEYTIVPYSTGTKLAIEDLTGSKARARLYDAAAAEFTPAATDALRLLFGMFDGDMDGILERCVT